MTLQDAIRIAQLRRKGNGVWKTAHVVEGYDEPFEQEVAGGTSEQFAAELAGYLLWRHLRKQGDKTLERNMVILQDITRG